MSSKRRGRKKGGAARVATVEATRSSSMPDLAMRSARSLSRSDDVVEAHLWASSWLGKAWSVALPDDRHPEQAFVAAVAEQALADPSRRGLAALEALRVVTPADALDPLQTAVAALRRCERTPSWVKAPPWTVERAWRGTDVWASVAIVFLDLAGPAKMTLVAPLDLTRSERVATIMLMDAGAAGSWTDRRHEDDVPLTVVEHPVEEAMAELAAALRTTDLSWPRTIDEGYIRHRALAWRLTRDHLPPVASWRPPAAAGAHPDGEALLEAFVGSGRTHRSDSARRIAQVCLEYGQDRFLGQPAAWSPSRAEAFMLDHLPNRVVLDGADVEALSTVIPAWIKFCLRQRGVPKKWITPVLDVVADCMPEMREQVAAHGRLAMGSSLASELLRRGVDLEDRTEVENAVRAHDAKELSRRLIRG